MFRKLLVPSDFSEWADAALSLLPALVRLGAREAILLHALDARLAVYWPDFVPLNESILEQRASETLEPCRQAVEAAGLRAEARVILGAPVETITETAVAEGVDLILMGSRRRSLLQHVVMGTVSENVIRHAPVPVLLDKWLPGRPRAAAEEPFAHVLFPTDFSPCADKAFRCLLGLASGGMRRATLLHVEDIRLRERRQAVQQPLRSGMDLQRLEQAVDHDRLEEIRERLEKAGVEVNVQVREGLPYRETLAAAEAEGATAIVLGSHGKSSMAEILLGSVSAEIIRQARLPVLVVRRDLDEEEPA